MITIKKRRRRLRNLVVAAALGVFITACGPPGARELQKGQEDIRKGRFDDAIVVLHEATRILVNAPHPVQARAWNLLGLACQQTNRLAEAESAYRQALKLDRNNADADFNLGCLRIQQTNFQAAIDLLTTYVTLRPRDAQGHLRLGDAWYHYALERTGRDRTYFFALATTNFQTADKISPSAEAANALGMVNMQSRPQNVRPAEANFRLALSRNPRCPPALLNLAILSQLYLQNPSNAVKYYRMYLTNAPSSLHAAEIKKLADGLDFNMRGSVAPPVPRLSAPATNPPPRAAAPSTGLNAAPTNPVAMAPTPPPVQPPVTSTPAVPHVATGASLPGATPVPTPVATPPATPAPAPAPTPAPAIAPSPPPQSTPQISAAPSAAQPSRSISPSLNASNVTPEPVVTEGVSAPRRTITQRLNPINWFSGTPKAQAEVSASASASKAEPPLVAPGTRYVYPPFVTPIPGDRAQAKGLQAEAIRARQIGDVAQSIRSFKAAIAADPTFYEAPLELGLTAIQIRDYTTALEELHRALSLQENSAEARYAFAWTLARRGYTEDAVRELGKLLSQHPNDVRGHLLLGSLYAVQLGQPKQAREQYAEALKLDPNNSQAANVRAWLEQNP